MLYPPHQKPTSPWFSGVLSEEDFEVIAPHRAAFLRQLRDLAARKGRILKDRSLTDDQKNVQLAELALPNPGQPSAAIRLEDLQYGRANNFYFECIVFVLDLCPYQFKWVEVCISVLC